jgi:hypothetical protein
VDAPLVELVDHHDLELGEQRVALQARREDSLRRDQEPRPAAELPVEADLPSDFFAEGPTPLGGDAAREAPGGDAPRLEDDGLPAAASAGGTRVVFPAPGGATITRARPSRSRSTISGMRGSMGSGFTV